MMLFPRALRILRESETTRVTLKDGVVISACYGGKSVTIGTNSSNLMSIREGSYCEFVNFDPEQLDDVGMSMDAYVKIAKKYGPPIGMHVSPRGYISSKFGAIRNEMMFNRHGELCNDSSPENSISVISSPVQGTIEYDLVHGDDKEKA